MRYVRKQLAVIEQDKRHERSEAAWAIAAVILIGLLCVPSSSPSTRSGLNARLSFGLGALGIGVVLGLTIALIAGWIGGNRPPHE